MGTIEASNGVYKTEDGDFPRVTAILGVINKPALVPWAAGEERKHVLAAVEAVLGNTGITRVGFMAALKAAIGQEKAHARLLSEAGDIGSQIHWGIEQSMLRIMGVEKSIRAITDTAQRGVNAWLQWVTEVQLKPEMAEQTVWSKTHEYAGTLDGFGELTLDGQRIQAVLDWKSSNGIYPEYELQVAAYTRALHEMGHCDWPAPGVIVRLPKKDNDPALKAGKLQPGDVRFIPAEKMEGLLEAFLAAKQVWKWQQAQPKWGK